MPVNLKGRSFLTLKDFTPDEIRYMLNLAADLKAKKRAGIRGNLLAGKNIVLLFEKTSTRTRCAFEVAAYDEGAHVTFLDSKSSQMGKKETMVDTAKVLGRFFDGIEYRGYDQKVVEGLAANAGVPVWNGLTDVDLPVDDDAGTALRARLDRVGPEVVDAVALLATTGRFDEAFVDAFSDAPPLVIFNNRSFISDRGRYNAKTRQFIPTPGAEVPEDYRARVSTDIDRRFYYSALVLDDDYYAIARPG